MVIEVLNLYAGGGGNTELWQEYNVTHIEKDKERCAALEEKYPDDTVICNDAIDYLLWNYDNFDFIWASPPCTNNSRFNTILHHNKIREPLRRLPSFRQYELVSWLKYYCKTKWAVENVDPYFEHPIKPDIKLGRHLIWCNFEIPYREFEVNYPSLMNKRGVDRDMVDPEIGKHIMDAAMNKLKIRESLGGFFS